MATADETQQTTQQTAETAAIPVADDCAHVELALLVVGRVCFRVTHVPANLSPRVCLRRDAADWPVTDNLHGQAIKLFQA